jgi:hypothetical protein
MRRVFGDAILVIAVIALFIALVIAGGLLVLTAPLRYWRSHVSSET